MTRLFLFVSSILVCTTGWSCAPSANVPPAPDLDAVLAAYENPTANVRGEVMGAVAGDIAAVRDELENSDVFNEILELIDNVQAGLARATVDNGNVEVLGQEIASPNGAIKVTFCCPGWEEVDTDCENPVNGTMDLIMTLESGSIGPIVWGTVAQCRYKQVVDGETLRAAFDGDVAFYLGDAVTQDQSLGQLLITVVLTGRIAFQDRDFPINQSFRIAESGRLDLLVQLDDSETFIYFFEGDALAQGIRDATGTFGCSLEDRECVSPSTSFSW